MEKSDSDRQREKSIYRVTIAGSIINAVLLALKFTAGILGGSAAMIADAVHSLSDFMTDIHNLRTRSIGNSFAIEMHLRMPGETSLYEAHQHTRNIEQRLRSRFGEHTHIALHIEPLKVNGVYVEPSSGECQTPYRFDLQDDCRKF